MLCCRIYKRIISADTPRAHPSRATLRSEIQGEKMTGMAKVPESTMTSLQQRLTARARERWPALERVIVKQRAGFAYVTGHLTDGEELPLFRLRYAGYANNWGFAIYRASHDDYEPSYLPNGSRAGTAEDALDCSCGLYLNDPSAWT
jgi:hypothetical protein